MCLAIWLGISTYGRLSEWISQYTLDFCTLLADHPQYHSHTIERRFELQRTRRHLPWSITVY
jgi:hypothetical protein